LSPLKKRILEEAGRLALFLKFASSKEFVGEFGLG
jgi:hypothetical protein